LIKFIPKEKFKNLYIMIDTNGNQYTLKQRKILENGRIVGWIPSVIVSSYLYTSPMSHWLRNYKTSLFSWLYKNGINLRCLVWQDEFHWTSILLGTNSW
jgi:hypothetical protein